MRPPRDPVPNAEHFGFADFLRATAILVVILSHLVPAFAVLAPAQATVDAMASWAVDVFFVLSGFLLGRPYVGALLARRKLPNWKRYARRRFYRIWPAYATVVVAGLALTNLHHGNRVISAPDLLTHLGMVHNLFPMYIFGDSNISLWTMGVDAQFYVALPLVAWVLDRTNGAGVPLQRLFGTLLAIAVVSIAWRLATAIAIGPGVPYATDFVFQRGIVGMGFCFATGVLLAILQERDVTLARSRSSGAILGLGVALSLGSFAMSNVDERLLGVASQTAEEIVATAGIFCIIYAVPKLRSTAFERLLNVRAITTVATYAYAMYLVHVPILTALDLFWQERGVNANSMLFVGLMIGSFAIALALFSYAVHTFIEKPFLSKNERDRVIRVFEPEPSST